MTEKNIAKKDQRIRKHKTIKSIRKNPAFLFTAKKPFDILLKSFNLMPVHFFKTIKIYKIKGT